MTSCYLYLGPDTIGWIDTENQLSSLAGSTSFPELSDKLAYIESQLARSSSSSVHLVVGNSLEQVRWQSSESRRILNSGHAFQRPSQRALQRRVPVTAARSGVAGGNVQGESVQGASERRETLQSASLPNMELQNMESQEPVSATADPLQVCQQFPPAMQRKLGFAAEDVCPQKIHARKSRKLIRNFECAAHPETLAWYRAVSTLLSREPLLISHTLLIESLVRSLNKSFNDSANDTAARCQTMLLVMALGDGFERHIYLAAGMVCLSRLVTIDHTAVDIDQLRNDTLQHVLRMYPSKDRASEEKPIVIHPVNLWCDLLVEINAATVTAKPKTKIKAKKARATRKKPTDTADQSIYGFLEKHIGRPAQTLSSVLPSPVFKSVVMENHFIATRKRELQQQSRQTLLQGAVGFSLTGLLLWQLTQFYGESSRVNRSEERLLRGQVELNRLQGQMVAASDPGWPTASMAVGFDPQQMKYVVEAGRTMHKHSILFPAACLLRIQEIKAGVPAIALDRIEWRSTGDDVFPASRESEGDSRTSRSELQLQLQLSGHIEESLSAASGLQLFESFLQSLFEGFSLQTVDEVQYPFNADPHSQIRGRSIDTKTEQKNRNALHIKSEIQGNANTAFEIKFTVSESNVSDLILMVESLVPEV